jgi:hypothetical protein
MASIGIGSLADEIARALEDFSEEVIENVDECSERIAKETVARLKTIKFESGNGNYSKSWRIRSEPLYNQPTNRVIHVAKPHYRLTHLLEYGHALVNGGRTQAKPHIGPAEAEAIERFEREVKEAIERG